MPAIVAFHEISFPLAVAFGSRGGPERRTEIVTLASGHEVRNARWADSRRRYDAGTGVKSLDDLHAVIAFFEERRGRLAGFRFRDRADWRSGPPGRVPTPADQPLGTGTGSRRTFQLVKRYGADHDPWLRPIVKPIAGTVLVAVDGVAPDPAVVTVDAATGVVTFAPGAAPPPGSAVTAGFDFEVPVRFDTDHLAVDLAAFAAGEIPHVPLLEIRL